MPHQLSITCIGLLAFAILIFSGCGTAEPPQQEETQNAPPAAEEMSSRQRVQQAKTRLVEELSGRLMKAISTSGAPAAIAVCKNDASKIAKRVSDELGLTIGRTSGQLRNPKNQPPEWAKSLIDQKVEEEQYVDLPDGSLRALLPIRLGAQCLACHGPIEQIEDDVKAALAEHYPNDQATGYQPNDLRGWFWVEVPK